jgi:aryl-alcohol dehydrogenase-like predicted oxidoreductase
MEQLNDAMKISEKYNCYPPKVEQPRYHMLDRHIEDGIMQGCEKHGIGLVVWSPLAQGLLTGKYNDGIPEGSRATTSEWIKEDLTEANIARVRKLCNVAKELDITMSQLALAWVLRRPEITSAITGATKIDHVKSNLIASNINLDDSTIEEIEKILR